MALMDATLPPLECEQVRIRNPKGDDIGDVLLDNTSLEYQYLFDEKDIHVQVVDQEMTFEFVNDHAPFNVFHVMVREFNPETWELGPIYELKIDKNLQANKFAALL